MNKKQCIIQIEKEPAYSLEGTKLYLLEGDQKTHVANICSNGLIRKQSDVYPYPLAYIDKTDGRVYRDDSKFGYMGMISKYGFIYDRNGENVGVIHPANQLFDLLTEEPSGTEVELEYKKQEEKNNEKK